VVCDRNHRYWHGKNRPCAAFRCGTRSRPFSL